MKQVIMAVAIAVVWAAQWRMEAADTLPANNPVLAKAEQPGLALLRTQFGKDTLAVESEYAKGITVMLAAYTNDLQAARDRAQQAGDLDKVKAILAEVARVQAEQMLPMADSALPEIKAIVPGYQLRVEQLALRRTQGLKKAAADYDKALDDLQKKLTQKGKIDEATMVQEARKELEAPAVAAPATISSVVVTVPPAAYHPAWARAVNLLKLIDPAKDTVKGDWRMEQGALVCSAGTFVRLEIPYLVPEEYDLRIKFTPMEGNQSLRVILVKSGRQFLWVMGDQFDKYFGFWMNQSWSSNPTTVKDGAKMQNGRIYQLIIQVRKDELAVTFNGEPIVRWKTDYQNLSNNVGWKLHDDSLLGIATSLSKVKFHSIDLLEITGKGRVVPRTTVASNVRGVGPTTSTAVADTEAWRLSEWSGQIVLPAGNYRGADKGVVLQNDCRIVVGPGTRIDGGRFVSANVSLHKTRWQVQRSLFRKVELHLGLEARFEANQSVFEECSFSKAGKWNYVLWDTWWSFEDCVFSKRFAFAPLWVRSYSVRAIGCTFYDMELPRVTYRTDDKDPSGQAQSRELRFERCRFVNCEVPESLLASTIDCVFDNCVFTTNENTGLSKASKPIVVNAFIVPGKTKPPQSYTKDKLQVSFQPAGPTQQAGSSLTVTRTGGVLKYAAVSEAGPVLVIGQIASPALVKTDSSKVTPAPSSVVGINPLSARAVLSREAVNATAWVTAGLDETVPPDIRQNLTYLREDLLDEGKTATQQVSNVSYISGWALCSALIAALDERDQARVRAGYRDAQAQANTKITSANLEATRTGARLRAFTSGDWPQYERERDQRTEIARQQNNQVALAKQVVLNEWAGRAATLRRGLDESYRRYREALRQDPGFQKREEAMPAAVTQPVAAPEKESGWITLFNGRDLDGWSAEDGDASCWSVTGGELVLSRPSQQNIWLLTTKDFADFILKFEFKLAPGANSGVTFHAVPHEGAKSNAKRGGAKHTEIQIQADASYPKEPAIRRTGGLFGVAIDRPGELRADGSWNDMEIEVHGRSLRVAVNGRDTLNIRLDQLAKFSADSRLQRLSGRIGFQAHGTGTASFRNIRIKECR